MKPTIGFGTSKIISRCFLDLKLFFLPLLALLVAVSYFLHRETPLINAFANGSFENGFEGWNGPVDCSAGRPAPLLMEKRLVNDLKADGESALELTIQNHLVGMQTAIQGLQPAKQYRISFWTKVADSDGGIDIGIYEGNVSVDFKLHAIQPKPDGWQKHNFLFQMTPGLDHPSLMIYAESTGKLRQIYFDRFEIFEVSVAQSVYRKLKSSLRNYLWLGLVVGEVFVFIIVFLLVLFFSGKKQILLVLFVPYLILALEITLQVNNLPPKITSGWFSNKDRFPKKELNQLEHRGQKINYEKNDFVVILTGDSFIESVSGEVFPFENMPEKVLERELGTINNRPVRVFTVASGGWSQAEEYLALQRYFDKYRADLVVAWVSKNDLYDMSFPQQMTFFKPTYWLKNGTLHGPTENIGETINKSKLISILQMIIWKEPKIENAIRNKRNHLWEKRILPKPYKLDKSLPPPLWKVDTLGSIGGEDLSREANAFAVWLQPRGPRLQYALDLYHQLVGRMQSLAEKNGARFIVVNASVPVPLLLNKYLPLRDILMNYSGRVKVGDDYFQFSADQYNQNVADMLKPYPHLTYHVTQDGWSVNDHDAHLNIATSEKAFTFFAQKIKESVYKGSR